MHTNQTPDYLSELLPEQVSSFVMYNIRNPNNHAVSMVSLRLNLRNVHSFLRPAHETK